MNRYFIFSHLNLILILVHINSNDKPTFLVYKRLSRWQQRYGADADWRVLDGVTLTSRGKKIEPPVCGSNAALCHITLTMFIVIIN